MADPETAPSAKRQTFGALAALFVTLALCATVVLATPRTLAPQDLPPLVLDARLAADAMATDEELAAKSPGGADVDELAQRYLDEGRAELAKPTEQMVFEARHRAWRGLVDRVFARVGKASVAALRAHTLQRFLQAFRGQTTDAAEKQGLLGSLPDLLRVYGLVARDGSLLGPELCLRTNFKARFNLIHGLAIADGFSAIETQAFEGWIALHAEQAPPDRRLQAARAFYGAGGYRGAQALATWLYRSGKLHQARALMARAHSERGELFARNYALSLSAAAF